MSTNQTAPQCNSLTKGRQRCTATATKVFVSVQRMRGGSFGEKRYPRCEGHPLGSADRVEPLAKVENGEARDG